MSEDRTVLYNTDSKAKRDEASAPRAQRELTWDELPIEQKIERMRWVTKQRIGVLEYRVAKLQRDVDELLDHRHDGHDGRVTVGIRSATRMFGAEAGGEMKPDNKEYF